MTSINVISIDPAKNAKSALHPEVFERLARECRISRDKTEYTISAKKSINLFFGINKKTGVTKSKIIFSFRILASLLLGAGVFYMGLSFSAFSLSWIMAALAVSLFFGLFTRIISFVSFGALSYLIAMTYGTNGSIELIAAATAFISLLFLVSGPAMFSLDQIIRKAMLKYARLSAGKKANRLAARRLSYQAIKYM